MPRLGEKLWFPDANITSPDGFLAYGGDLSWQRLLLAYNSGIFPWYNKGEPILWWSPNPRFVLYPDKLLVSKSMKKILERKFFKVTENQAFEYVITQCAINKRKGEFGTWITQEMKEAYVELHKKGYAKSIEVWNENGDCVGGFYGVDLGNVFCGESMFALETNASKYAFIYFVKKYENKYKLIDCQIHSNHLQSLGAENLKKSIFLDIIKNSKVF